MRRLAQITGQGLVRPAPGPLIAALLIVAALLALASAAAAQTGGTYGLRWHTIDGGGATQSNGGAYTLGGAAGQPDAQAPAAGGSYGLQGGFRTPACAPEWVPVSAGCVGTTVVLGWPENGANMGYDIHRSTTPCFSPGLATKVASITGHAWPDPLHCGDPLVNYYYRVRATCIGAHVDTALVGEFDFALTPGSTD